MQQWISQQQYDACSDNGFEAAAKKGCLEMVKWLVGNGLKKEAREAVQVACGEGHLSVVKWFVNQGGVLYPHFATQCAIRNGHLDIVKYLCEVGIAYEPSLMVSDGASHGHLHLIKWFLYKYETGLFPKVDYSRVGRSNQTAMGRAANNGHEHVLEFLHLVAMEMQREGKSGGPSCTNWALQSASTMCHLEVVKWLQVNYRDLSYSPSTTIMVARNGNLEMLQWLHRQDRKIEWPSDVIDCAAENGHLAVVKWLHVKSQRRLHEQRHEPSCIQQPSKGSTLASFESYGAGKGKNQFASISWITPYCSFTLQLASREQLSIAIRKDHAIGHCTSTYV